MPVRMLPLLLIALFISAPAFAEIGSTQLITELSEGMSQNEVLQTWGAPKEKIEQEAKRVDIWIYDDSKVSFLEGKLVGIESIEGARVALKEDDSESDQIKPASDIAVSDILNEIMDSTKEE